jgi:hypothetical protein
MAKRPNHAPAQEPSDPLVVAGESGNAFARFFDMLAEALMRHTYARLCR